METIIQEALRAYRSLGERLGRKPSSTEFYEIYSKTQLYQAFEGGNAYSRLQELAGDVPNQFSRQKSNLDEILLSWGKLARKTLTKYNKLPLKADWKINGITPSVSGVEKSHHIRWSTLPGLFKEKFSQDPLWKDVISAIPHHDNTAPPTHQPMIEKCYVYLMRDSRNGLYKIGISSDPGRRESTLQSEQPKIELIASKSYVNRKMALIIEKALHETFGHKRSRGEWFNLDAEDVHEISATLDE